MRMNVPNLENLPREDIRPVVDAAESEDRLSES
jgi:hypothetical protein